MSILYGRKKHILKRQTVPGVCESCGNQQRDLKVCQSYYHIFFIPIVPASTKFVESTCLNCRNSHEAFNKEYLSGVKTPLFFYSVPIFLLIFISVLISGNLITQRQKALYVSDPKVGDTYLIRDDTKGAPRYYFLKIRFIYPDSEIVELIHNAYQYSSYVSKMHDKDYFVYSDVLQSTRENLKGMLKDGIINAVERNPTQNEKFIERIKKLF